MAGIYYILLLWFYKGLVALLWTKIVILVRAIGFNFIFYRGISGWYTRNFSYSNRPQFKRKRTSKRRRLLARCVNILVRCRNLITLAKLEGGNLTKFKRLRKLQIKVQICFFILKFSRPSAGVLRSAEKLLDRWDSASLSVLRSLLDEHGRGDKLLKDSLALNTFFSFLNSLWAFCHGNFKSTVFYLIIVSGFFLGYYFGTTFKSLQSQEFWDVLLSLMFHIGVCNFFISFRRARKWFKMDTPRRFFTLFKEAKIFYSIGGRYHIRAYSCWGWIVNCFILVSVLGAVFSAIKLVWIVLKFFF